MVKTKAFFLFLLLWAGFYFSISIPSDKFSLRAHKWAHTRTSMLVCWSDLEKQAIRKWPEGLSTSSEPGQLLDNFDYASELSLSEQYLDEWGNRLNFLVNFKRPPGSNAPLILVYSNGEDGVSASGGNDPDDINLFVYTDNLDKESLAKGIRKVWEVDKGKHNYYHVRSRAGEVWNSQLWRSMILASILSLVIVSLICVVGILNGKPNES